MIRARKKRNRKKEEKGNRRCRSLLFPRATGAAIEICCEILRPHINDIEFKPKVYA
jgi:hypothetical protein